MKLSQHYPIMRLIDSYRPQLQGATTREICELVERHLNIKMTTSHAQRFCEILGIKLTLRTEQNEENLKEQVKSLNKRIQDLESLLLERLK